MKTSLLLRQLYPVPPGDTVGTDHKGSIRPWSEYVNKTFIANKKYFPRPLRRSGRAVRLPLKYGAIGKNLLENHDLS
jgi:hypothetical protein